MLVFLGIFLLSLTSGVWSSDGCRKNEVYTNNPEPCRPTCANPRAENCTNPCHEEYGCKCKTGYILNKDVKDGGKCVRLEQCKQCGELKRAHPVECGSRCPPTCEDPEPSCTEECVYHGCQCNKGLILYCHTGPCVNPRDCPGGAPKCGANETYTKSKKITIDSYCPGTANSDNVKSGNNGQPGCVCKRGYRYKCPEEPVCIKKSDCPPVCGENETYTECKNITIDSYCPHTVNSDDVDSGDNGNPGCVCKDGYKYYNKEKKCVKKKDCPCYGDKTRRYSNCSNAPQPSCNNLNPNTTDDCVCEEGCVCNDGLVVSEDGDKCIKPEECSSCEGDKNSTGTSCKPNCEPTCDNPVCPDTSCKSPCERACVCKPGYIRRCDGGPCIAKTDCPPVCGENETYTECKNITIDSYCPHTVNSDDVDSGDNGNPGCVCKDGYKYYNKEKKCVKTEDCPCYGDETRRYSNCSNAPQPSCNNLNPNTTDDCVCEEGCVCNDGLVVSEDGDKCIKPEECSSCEGDKNSTGTSCKPNCEPTCDNPVCPDTSCKSPCERACVCKPGYIRRCDGGPCIAKTDCPPVCGENETYTECKNITIDSYCPHTVNSDDVDSGDNGNPGCVCKDGYKYYNKEKKCVKTEDCPCYGDETRRYSNCSNAPQPSCNNLNPNTTDDCVCEEGCVCNDGLVVSEDGDKCIKPEECSSCEGDKNSTGTSCKPNCEPTCDNPVCPDTSCKSPCERACVCKPGYIRRCDGGPCIAKTDCPPVCGENETYTECKNITIDSYCPHTVNSDDVDSGDNGNPGCVCKDGYKYYNKEKKCVKTEDCPCYGDETRRYSNCSNAPQPSCNNLNPNTTDDCVCEEGCVCNDGLVVSEDGDKCIKPEECSSCEGDKNSTGTSCKPNCEPTCDNPVCPDTSCKSPCERACVCKPGYIRRCDGGPCIAKTDCPK